MNWEWDEDGMDSDNNNNGWFKFDDFEIKNSDTIKGKNINFKYKKTTNY